MSMCSRIGSPREKGRLMGRDRGRMRGGVACSLYPSQLLTQTSVSDREPQVGLMSFGTGRSPATPSPNRTPEEASGTMAPFLPGIV